MEGILEKDITGVDVGTSFQTLIERRKRFRNAFFKVCGGKKVCILKHKNKLKHKQTTLPSSTQK